MWNLSKFVEKFYAKILYLNWRPHMPLLDVIQYVGLKGTKSDTTTMIARNRAPNRSSNAQPDRTGSNDRSGCVSGSNRSGRATGSDCSTAPTESTELVVA
ncbi:hypothetical protein L3X38_031837 [Prunus dulcis]|uniref:Uncharacterized protein n=1 Tax=Prunus dulcis TaxID=3755 RepID=A0AAD4YVB0_PRUDU|nr:hypothetical protein L3X38_031837 [Prunus dulcis]